MTTATLDEPRLRPDTRETPTPRPTPTTPAATPAPVATPATASRSSRKRTLAALLIAVALIPASYYGYSYLLWSRAHESTDNAFIDAHIIQLSSRVLGHVAAVHITDNQLVHEGDLLLELDPADFQAALDQATAELVAAQAGLTAAKNAVEEANAQTASAEAAAAQSQAELASRDAEFQRQSQDLEQYTKARDAVSTLEWGKADTAVRTTKAARDAAIKAVAAADAQINHAMAAAKSRESQVAVAEAKIQAAAATEQRARLNLSYTKITATSTGRVTRKSVEPGNFIIPGQPLMALVQPDVWVTANFKETQLTRMKPGQPVDLEVDAYPGLKLTGHVDSLQQGAGARFSLLPPENATGNYVKVVQRVPVKITLDALPTGTQDLGPGMSVVPTITTSPRW